MLYFICRQSPTIAEVFYHHKYAISSFKECDALRGAASINPSKEFLLCVCRRTSHIELNFNLAPTWQQQ